jgi:hypothetical protein
MRISAKKLTINKKVANISFDIQEGENQEAETELKAICILLGLYNQYGRKIEPTKYEQIREKFTDAIQELKELI